MYSYRSPSQPREEMPPWLASLVLKRGGDALTRFAVHYQRLASMPRAWRQRLRRKLAVSLSSAALIMTLAGPLSAPPPVVAAPDATIVVVNGEVADVTNGQCGLIEAIINARTAKAGQLRPDCAAGNLSGPDTVSLPANGLFVLTQAHNNQFGYNGLPVITSAVTIEGHDATIRRSDVSGTPRFRILAVDANGALTLRDTTISNGRTTDGADIHGGGIFALGQLTLDGAIISGNSAGNGQGYGGGVYAGGPTTITNSEIVYNRTTGWGDGYGPGGGLFIGGQATITGSLISGNEAHGGYWSDGGGIAVRGQATIVDSIITANLSGGSEGGGAGGGVWVGGQATISGTTIANNVVETFYEYSYGGGITPWSGFGGGLGNSGTTLLTNTTISDNTADVGGGLANFFDGDLTVTHSTVTGNDNRGVFSGRKYGQDNCSTTNVRGSIVSGNNGGQIFFEPTPGGENDCDAGDAAVFNLNAFNVLGQGGNAGLTGLTPGATDIVPAGGLASILSPLADNGGPTLTHALPAGSPALDLAPNASCTAAPVNGVDQRGEPRNQNGAGGATNHECDAGAFERGGGVAQMGFYVSAGAAGTVGGVAFAPGDILKFTPAGGWSMFFDASDVGITKNVVAVEIEDNGDILLALAAAQTVPGAGSVQPQDVLRFTPSSTGNTTAGTFAMALDGSTKGLTTSGEKIDALGRTDGRIAISTVGAAAVKRPDNTTLKAQDEDALGFNLVSGQWSEYFNGTAIPGLAAEDVNALWIDPTTGDLYISIVGGFNFAGVKGDGKDIVKLSPSGAPGGYTPSLFWDGSANGFPASIDALEMIP